MPHRTQCTERNPRPQVWKSLTRLTIDRNMIGLYLFYILISSWMIPCAPRYQIGSGATVTNDPYQTSPIPNYIPIFPEKSVIIEQGEINMPNISEVLTLENSKSETPVSELGQFSDIQSETQNSLLFNQGMDNPYESSLDNNKEEVDLMLMDYYRIRTFSYLLKSYQQSLFLQQVMDMMVVHKH